VTGGGSGTPVSFVFTNNTVVTANNDTNDNTFSIYVDAVVLNTNINIGTSAVTRTFFTNKCAVSFGGNLPLTTNGLVIVTNVEPVIAISTSFRTNRMDAGDTNTIYLVVTNTGLATAYDVVVTDALNTVYFDRSTVTNFLMNGIAASGYLLTELNGLVTISSDTNGTLPPVCSLEANEGITFSFDVKAAQTLPPNLTITNRAGIYADTIAGYALNQRTVTAQVATATNQSPALVIAKYFSGTSETNAADSTNQFVQVGETVTYQLAVTLPEGTVSNLMVTDLIPRGMQYVTNRVDTNSFGGTLGGPQGVTGGGSGTPVSFVFTNNTVVTDNNNTNDNTFSIYVDAVVLNTNINIGTSAVTRTFFTNKCAVSFGGNLPLTTNGLVIVTNVEPVIAISTSFRTNRMDAGDTNTIYLVVTNTGLATAYDVVVTDALNTVYFDRSTVTNFLMNGVAASGYLLTELNGLVTISSDTNGTLPPVCSLEANEGITFSFDVKAAQTLPPNLTITNRAGIYADTIAGYALNQRTITAQVATATNQSPVLSIAKYFSGTSETNSADSTNQFVQVGETVTYQLAVTLPEGTVSNLMVTDLIPRGMQYVTNRVDTNSFGGTLGGPQGVTGGGSGAPVSFVFTNNTVVTDNNNTNDNTFSIYVDAVVLNTNINIGTSAVTRTFFTNKCAVSFGGNLPLTTNGLVIVTNVEPVIAISTSFRTNRMDAGDTNTIYLVVTNTGLATAYDVVVTDVLNTVYFDRSTITNFLMNGVAASGYLLTELNGLVTISSDTNGTLPPVCSLEANEGITFSFDVKAAQTLPPNLTITNRAGIYADTIAGYALNQRTVTAQVATATNQSPDVAIIKSFYNTSETNAADSTNQFVQVGETVTYQLAVTLPEGTVSNLMVTDLMPRGMQYVTNRVDTTGFGGTLGAPLGVTGGGSGTPVSFVFTNNTVVTDNNNPNDNTFSIYVDAVVLNTNINIGMAVGSRTFFTNKCAVSFGGNLPSATNGLVIVTNIEPVIAISKAYSTNLMDAGDTITAYLVVTNTGLATAYDLVVTDAVNSVYFDTNNSVASFKVNGQAPAGYVMRAINGALLIVSDTNSASAPANSLEANEGITFSYDMVAAQTVPPNTRVNLTASFRADTMAASPAEQRVLVAVDATAGVDIPNIGISKTLEGTSLTHAWESAATNLQIGEIATYRIDVTMPEGTVTNLVVTDLIPAGMKYIAPYRLLVPSQMTLGTHGATGGSVGGEPVVITFNGNVVVGNDNNPANNTLGIEVDAVVLDTNLNSGLPGAQTVFTNQATAAISGPGGNTVTSSKVYTYAVEPSLRMIKTMTGPVNGLVTISLVVTNEGLATAFDIAVTDRLDAAYFQTNTLVNTVLPAGFTYSSVVAPDASTIITLMSGDNSMLPTNAIKAGEAATFMFNVQSKPNAGRSVTNVAFIISNSTVSGSSPWERVEPVVSGTNILALPMSTITKTVANPLVDVGQMVSYLIAVSNAGTLGMSSVLVTDTYPTNYITFVNAVPVPDTTLVGGTLVWSNVGPIVVGGGTNIAVNFRAIHNTYPGVMTNLVSSAVVTTNGASPAIISGSATNAILPAYALSKTVIFPVGRSAVTSGPAYFQMTVTNTGDAVLNSIRLDDRYDTNVLLITSATGATYTVGQGALLWTNIGPLAVGAVASVTGNFTAVASTGASTTTNSVVSSATFEGLAGLTILRTNWADLKVTIPVGVGVVMTNPTPDGSNITFQITTVSGAVYRVISVSNNIDHPYGQDWRHMVTWSNMPTWVTYTDSNVLAEAQNTRFYQIVWEEAGVTQTNPVMYEAFVQNLITGWWHELSMPVECFDYELNKTLGDKLKIGLRGDNATGDLLFALREDGTWHSYMLSGANKWVRDDGSGQETTDRISPKSGYWVKRQMGGASTNIEYAGPVRLTSETNTFLPRTWQMISWPFPRSRTEGYGTNKGWGFAAAGAHGDINWPNADRLYVSSGLTTTILYMRPDGRWYRVGNTNSPASDVRLQHGVGYYYYHSGTGFVWAAESPIPDSNWWQ